MSVFDSMGLSWVTFFGNFQFSNLGKVEYFCSMQAICFVTNALWAVKLHPDVVH